MATSQEELEALRRLAELEAAKVKPSLAKNVSTIGAALKKTGSDLLSGLGQGAAMFTQGVGNTVVPTMALPARLLKKPAEDLQKKSVDFGKEYGLEPGYGKTIAQSVGSAAAVPLGAGSPIGALGLLGGGIGAGAGQEAAKNVDENNIPLQIAATLVGGVGGGYLFGPRQSIARRDIRLETENLTKADWDAALKNIKDFNASGSTTATLGESFPGQTGVKSLTLKAAQGRGGEVLRNQLAQREDDIKRMGLEIPGLVDPRSVSLTDATREAAEAATRRLNSIKSAAQRPLTNIRRDEAAGKLPPIPEQIAKQLVEGFEKNSRRPMMPRADALGREDMLPAFLDPNAPDWQRFTFNPKTKVLEETAQEGPQQSLSSLLLNIAENTPSATSASAKAGITIGKGGQNRARAAAFDSVNLLPDPFGKRAAEAGEEYLRRKEAWVTPAEEGPLRKIAGSKNPEGIQLSEARLNAILDDPLMPGKTGEVLRELKKGGADTKAIARALVENKLVEKPSAFANTLAGEPGSAQARQLDELLTAAGVDPLPINQRINTSNALTLRPGMNIKELPQMRAMQALLRPFRTIDMRTTAQTEAGVNRELAELLYKPTPEKLAELQKIAMFDPVARRMLSAVSGILPQSLLMPEGE
jgi:hypothetical protein